MTPRYDTDYELDSLRRSLAMLNTNQLALTRDQGMELVTSLIKARAELRRLARPQSADE
jgi:hypothetical protein